MLLLFAIRVAKSPSTWERAVHSVTVRVFRERLSNFVCVLLSLLILRAGCGILLLIAVKALVYINAINTDRSITHRYSRLSLSRNRRDPQKQFEISVLRHIRIVVLRIKQFEQPIFTNDDYVI